MKNKKIFDWWSGSSGGGAQEIANAFSARVIADGGTYEADSCLVAQINTLKTLGLYDSANLILTPNGVKSGKLYSLKPTSGAGDFTFTRAGTKTRNGPSVIETVATGVPSLDHISGSCPSISLEPQRTNLIIRSEEFDNAAWVKTNITVTANTDTAPDGTSTGDSCDITNATNALYQDVTVVASTVYRLTFYAKRGTAASLNYRVFNNTGAADIVASTNYYSLINSSTYTRVVVSFTTPVGCVSVRIYLSNDSSVGTFFLWGSQLEAGGYPTSYIPTTSATVTRIEDTISKTGLSAIIPQTEGTVFLIAKFSADNQTKRILISVSGASNDSLIIQASSSNTINFSITTGNVGQVSISSSAFTDMQALKIACVYANNRAALFVNGVKSGEDLSVAIAAGLSQITNQLQGGISLIEQLSLLPVMSDNDAIILTT